MPQTKGTIFLNPSSGNRFPPAEKQSLEAAARDSGLEVVHLTRDVNVTETIRQRMRDGISLFVAAGGDGTINHVVQPLVNSEATLAVIPVGTYNHFAKDLGIPLDWREALDVVLNGEEKQVDTGRTNDRFFVNNLSMGLYPELVARREAKGRDYPRWKARLAAFYSTFQHYPHVSFTVETEHHQEVVRTQLFMVSNNSYDLSRIGIEAPRNTLSEGRLSVYWLPHLPRLELMKFAAHYLAGRVTTAPGFRSFRTSRLKVQSPRRTLPVGVDGELFSLEVPLVITTVPTSLLVKVPRGG
ncbi:MAG: diacylglycerol/lipid kinase family protein [Thermoanaerobaculia bacterium]